MPCIPLHPPSPGSSEIQNSASNPLPQLLQTPSGLAILEIQGTINLPGPAPEADQDSSKSTAVSVGRLVFPDYDSDDLTGNTTWMKHVHLYVGRHQRLTGEVKKLPNPIAVIRRKPAEFGEDSDEEQLQIVEIIYYKLLFSSRPEPVSG